MLEHLSFRAVSSLAIGPISDQLDQLRQSEVFRRSSRLFALLKFLVDETVSGRGDTLKELFIGNALYSRDVPYDPRTDSSVRMETRRLRRKLHEYYSQYGQRATVRISLPRGSYRPAFTFGGIESSSAQETKSTCDDPVDLAIMPFHTLAGSEAYDHVADGLADEIIFALEEHDSSIRITPRLLVFQFKRHTYTLPEAIRTTRARIFLCGTVRATETLLRITVELSDPLGFILWSTRFDNPPDQSLQLQELLAKRIVAEIPTHLLRQRRA